MSGQVQVPIPKNLRPIPKNLDFDLSLVLSAVVQLRATIDSDAYTADMLGTKRAGHAVMISSEGIFVTISYLLIEAKEVWLIDNTGAATQAHVLGIDQRSGFAVLKTIQKINASPLNFKSSKVLTAGQPVIFAGAGGNKMAMMTEVISCREFSGYWEYLLDKAIFTTPAHPFWGGGGLIGMDGELKGIGSLYIQENNFNEDIRGCNMVVPISLLPSMLNDILENGRVTTPPRPWLGTFTAEANGKIIVCGLWPSGPAELAGLEEGDAILEVNQQYVNNIADFYRTVWALGNSGTKISLLISREENIFDITIISADRSDFYKKPVLH